MFYRLRVSDSLDVHLHQILPIKQSGNEGCHTYIAVSTLPRYCLYLPLLASPQTRTATGVDAEHFGLPIEGLPVFQGKGAVETILCLSMSLGLGVMGSLYLLHTTLEATIWPYIFCHDKVYLLSVEHTPLQNLDLNPLYLSLNIPLCYQAGKLTGLCGSWLWLLVSLPQT